MAMGKEYLPQRDGAEQTYYIVGEESEPRLIPLAPGRGRLVLQHIIARNVCHHDAFCSEKGTLRAENQF